MTKCLLYIHMGYIYCKFLRDGVNNFITYIRLFIQHHVDISKILAKKLHK